jgi:hypothetical protein
MIQTLGVEKTLHTDDENITPIALIFWYWMWGVPGAILAVPMLAITKIISTGSGCWQPSATFLRDSRLN